MNTVINLRGTSGSGKTTVVVNLIAACRGVMVKRYGLLGPTQPEAVQVWGPSRLLTVLGPYPQSGGDSIVSRTGIKGVIELVEKYRAEGDVLFEALIISSMYGTVGRWLREHPPAIVAVLDVPLSECQAGLYERQQFQKVAKTQEAHYKGTMKVAKKMKTDGIRVEYVTRQAAVPAILEWLK